MSDTLISDSEVLLAVESNPDNKDYSESPLGTSLTTNRVLKSLSKSLRKDFRSLPDYCPVQSRLNNKDTRFLRYSQLTPLNLEADTDLTLLYIKERRLAEDLGIYYSQYLVLKRQIFINVSELGLKPRRTTDKKRFALQIKKVLLADRDRVIYILQPELFGRIKREAGVVLSKLILLFYKAG